jgi:hypothetical protein
LNLQPLSNPLKRRLFAGGLLAIGQGRVETHLEDRLPFGICHGEDASRWWSRGDLISRVPFP